MFAQLFSPHPPFPQILDGFIHGRFELLVSTEILLEYEEVIVREFSAQRWNRIWTLMQRVNAHHKTLSHVTPHFRFQVIVADPDDNKFVDCAIAGRAELLVTLDRHFNEVASLGYAIRVISPDEFALVV